MNKLRYSRGGVTQPTQSVRSLLHSYWDHFCTLLAGLPKGCPHSITHYCCSAFFSTAPLMAAFFYLKGDKQQLWLTGQTLLSEFGISDSKFYCVQLYIYLPPLPKCPGSVFLPWPVPLFSVSTWNVPLVPVSFSTSSSFSGFPSNLHIIPSPVWDRTFWSSYHTTRFQHFMSCIILLAVDVQLASKFLKAGFGPCSLSLSDISLRIQFGTQGYYIYSIRK